MTNKKIFIEGLGLVEGHFSGVGQYILGILRGLDALMEKEKIQGNITPDIRVIIPYNTIDKFNSFNFKHLKAQKFPLSFRFMSALWYRGKMPPLDLILGRGYYIFTRFVTMPLLFSESLVIIYDISFETHRQFSDEKNAIFLSNGIKKSIKTVSKVFTISKNAKKEIVRFYKLPKKDVIVATPAADQKYFYKRSASEIEEVKRKYDIKKPYILALSNLEPRKNLDLLVDAYCKLPKKYRDKNSLLLVGVNGWKSDALFKKIINLVNSGYDIVRPNKYVTDDDKPAIISGAKMLVYPSHYEGFGMPPLEALACGVPVITSDNSSLPEVVGDVGTMINCKDLKGLTLKIINLLDNHKKILSKISLEGPKQARKFTWENSAKKYWNHILEKTT